MRYIRRYGSESSFVCFEMVDDYYARGGEQARRDEDPSTDKKALLGFGVWGLGLWKRWLEGMGVDKSVRDSSIRHETKAPLFYLTLFIIIRARYAECHHLHRYRYAKSSPKPTSTYSIQASKRSSSRRSSSLHHPQPSRSSCPHLLLARSPAPLLLPLPLCAPATPPQAPVHSLPFPPSCPTS